MTKLKQIIPLVLLVITLCSGAALAADQSPININQASVEELAELPHVGPKRAQLIIAHRKKSPFRSVEELTEIKGIGDKTLEKIKPHVRVAPATTAKR